MRSKKIIIAVVVLIAVAAAAYGGIQLYKTIMADLNASRVSVEAVRISPELQQTSGNRSVHITAELDMTNNSRHALAAEQLPYFKIGYGPVYATIPGEALEASESATGVYEFDVVMTTSVVLVFPEGVEVSGVDPDSVWKTIATSASDLLNKPQVETQNNNSNSSVVPPVDDHVDIVKPAQNDNSNVVQQPDNVDAPTASGDVEAKMSETAKWANALIPQRLGDAMGDRHLGQMNVVIERDDRRVVAGKISPNDPNSQLPESDFFAVFDAAGQLIELTVDGQDMLNPVASQNQQ